MPSSFRSYPRFILPLAVVSALSIGALNTSVATAESVRNTAYGTNAFFYNTTGLYNSAFGYSALKNNTQGDKNSAIGYATLYSNTRGYYNTGLGYYALYQNTEGYSNTAVGMYALSSNTVGTYNTAIGRDALGDSSTGEMNTASGYRALYGNTTGSYNSAFGVSALDRNEEGKYNTSIGFGALQYARSGNNSTAVGTRALFYSDGGSNNIALGNYAGAGITTGSNNIEIGTWGDGADDAVIRVGDPAIHKATYIAGISGVKTTGGVQVFINSAGQLGTVTSSQRFKKDIKSLDSVSNKLLQLRPVSFIYKEDEKNEVQYGLIAEEVAKVYPELVQYDQQGKPFTVYYRLLTPLLLSELQRQYESSSVQQEKIDAQQAELISLREQLSAQRAEMLAMKQQQDDVMTTVQARLTQLDTLIQARNERQDVVTRVAVIDQH